VRGDDLTTILKSITTEICALDPPSGHVTTVSSCSLSISVNTTHPNASVTNYEVCLNPSIVTQLNDNTASIATLTTCCNNSIKSLESLDGSINVTDEGSGVWNIEVTPPSGNSQWSTTGNSGLSSANFLGTNDAVDLVFKTNGIKSGLLNISDFNTAFGVYGLFSLTSGTDNTGIGYTALVANTSGSLNTAVGTGALALLNVGSNNTGIGKGAGAAITSGSFNTTVGSGSGVNVTTGSYNTSLGYQASPSSSGSLNRISIGYGASATANFQFALPDDVTTFKWRGITYTMPSSNAVGVLTNDGAGNLTWA